MFTLCALLGRTITSFCDKIPNCVEYTAVIVDGYIRTVFTECDENLLGNKKIQTFQLWSNCEDNI